MKKLLILLLILSVQCSMFNELRAQTFEVGNVRYSILSAGEMTAQIEKALSGSSTDDIWIPDEVQYQGQNYTVVKAGPSSFSYCYSHNIRLPGGLKEIARGAFWACWGLHSIDLPWSLEVIGETAFYNCALESINIPGSVRSIGSRAFADCTILASVELNGGTESIGSGVFAGCNKLRSITVPWTVKEIGAGAFPYNIIESLSVEAGNPKFDSRNNCNGIVESATATLVVACKNTKIPSSVSKLGDYVFSGADFSEFDIPKTINSLGTGVFQGCGNLTRVGIHDGITELPTATFAQCGFTEFTVPETVTKIGSDLFYGCTKLTNVTLHDGITEVPDRMCFGCTELKEFTFPPTVTRIGAEAFRDTGLTEVTIPAATTEVAPTAYAYCSLKHLTVEEGNPKYDSRNDCNSIIETETNTLVLATCATVIPDDVETLAENAFHGVKMDYLDVPESVTDIKQSAFNVSAIDKVNIKANITKLENYTFNNTGVDVLSLPPTLVSIGQYAIPPRVKTLVLPASVKTLHYYVHNGYNLSTVVCLGTEPPGPYDGYAGVAPFLDQHYGSVTLYVPKGSLETYQNNEWVWSRFANIKELPLRGDVNADGSRNTADVVAIYSYIISGTESGMVDYFADVDENLKVNTADVVNVYKLIIEGDAGQ